MSASRPDAPGPDAAAARERQAMTERYARRAAAEQDAAMTAAAPARYSMLRPEVWQMVHERERAIVALLREQGWHELSGRRVFEVGCGRGDNLLELLRLGFAPNNLSGVELLPDRVAQARQRLPAAIAVHEGDALALEVPAHSLDLVLQSTVFTSILDASVRQRLALAMWQWLRPGGAVLWYDFTIDNPRNPDVRGVPMSELKALFPQAAIRSRRVTLAPPLARAACAIHPALYTLFNALPPLRTHILAWLTKPHESR